MKKRNLKRDEGKERFWRETISRQAASGQSVRAYCRVRGLTESAFYFWRRELKKRDGEKRRLRADRSFSGDERKPEPENGSLFVPVVAEPLGKTAVATAGGTADVEMVLPSGSVVRWAGGDVDAWVEAIAALEARLC